MFKKTNSRALNFINVLLIGQIMIGAIYLAYLVFSLLTATSIESIEWVRVFTIIIMATVILELVNRPNAKFMTPKMTRAEKVFKLICLGVVDVAACLAVIYLFSLPLEQSELSENSMIKAAGCAVAITGVFLVLLAGASRMRLFRRDFSRVLNFALMVAMLGVGWSTAWLLSYLVCGPNGESIEVMTAYDAQLMRCSLTMVILMLAMGAMVCVGNNRVHIARLRKEMQSKTKPKKATSARG